MAQPSDHNEPTLQSRFANDPEMAHLVRGFVDELPDRVAALRHAWEEARLQHLRVMSGRLKGSSEGHGFAPVGAAADSLTRQLLDLQEECDMAELRRLESTFHELMELCARVR